MSESETNQAVLCAGCKVDLSRSSHLEDCSVLAKMKAEQDVKEAAKVIEDSKKIAEKAAADARKQLEQNNNKKINEIKENLKKENEILRKKNIIIDRLFKLEPSTEIPRDELLKFDLQQLAECYKQVLQTINSEKTCEFQYRVTCPLCLKLTGETKELGHAKSQDDAVKLLNQHKKLEHKSSSASWIITGIIFAMLAAGSFAAYKIYKKKKETETK